MKLSEARTSQAQWFVAAGVGMLALAGFFLWQELALRAEYVLSIAAVASAALAVAARSRTLGFAGAVGVLACVAGGGMFYAATRADALLPGIALGFAGAVVAAAFTLGRAQAAGDVARERLLWSALVAGALAASWAAYFRFLTLGFPDHVERRLVLTLAWLVTGLVLAVTHQRRANDAARWAGYAFVAAALAKAVAYDTTHLDGALRVAVLAAAGGLLMVGGWLSARAHAARALDPPDGEIA
ncbi:MAG TPA: hypothetical protein VFF06_01300 [Polyangia bacterium]|nr:hypothetical protein [Polyangia bacterium]